MLSTRFFRVAGYLCLMAVWALCGLPADATAAQTPARTSTPPKAGTGVRKSTTSTAKARAAAARARRARVARARAAASARALKEAQEPRFKLDESGSLVPSIRAEAAIVYNPETGKVLWEENSQNQRSIASITKVMTATVFLENAPDLSEVVAVTREDARRASTTYLKSGDRVTTGDLLHLLLIASDNIAARTLARVSPYGSAGFIDRMNEKADELGLDMTHYVDPSGLFDTNVSSAYDMARLIAYAASDERIGGIMQMQGYSLAVGKRTVTVRSTNQLVTGGDVDVLGGKTGFIRRAGYCLATLLRLPQGGPQVAVVVLGAKSSAVRFWETRHLFNWLSARAGDLLEPGVAAQTVPVLN